MIDDVINVKKWCQDREVTDISTCRLQIYGRGVGVNVICIVFFFILVLVDMLYNEKISN